MHRCEHDVGNAASIDVQRGQIGVAVMAEEPIERMDGFSCRAGDHRLVQRRVAVGDGGVDLDHWVATIMGVDRSAGFARPAQVEGLAIRGSPVSRSEEHTSELQSLMRISYAVFCLKKKTQQ